MYSLDKLRPFRAHLLVLAALGLLGLNGVFVYFAVFEPHILASAMRNPVSLVFMIEAFVIVGLAAFVIRLMGFERPGWVAFVALSLLGGLAFSVPLFLSWHLRTSKSESGAHSAG